MTDTPHTTATELWESLHEAWLVLSATGRSLALMSPLHAEGVVAPLYRRREDAEQAAHYYAEIADWRVLPVPELWQAVQLLAQQGFAGLLVDEQIPLFWMTTQLQADAPTHLALPQEDGLLLLLDADGPTPLDAAQAAAWRDLERFDRLSIIWMLRDTLPFAGYEENMPLWEFLPPDGPKALLDKGALLADDSAHHAALPLFTTRFAADWYWQNIAHAPAPLVQAALTPHDDVPLLLDARHEPELALILNPGRHRFYQGFFRLIDNDWYLITINGVWHIDPPFDCTQVARRA